ncbi:DNA translocase FtsK-like [Anopheles arabiensis]|uniref:DNA translocase FtsK-like n=1 Tax=Anopheles arabiensis TaxID=7173 RepID=UPI001AADA448|nr:DNA translocase FtsK-like [Anopheles arabiensis]
MAFHLLLRLLSFIFWCGLITIRPAGALPAGPGIEIMPAQFSMNGQLDYVVVNENEETNTNFLEQQPVLVREPQRQAEYVVPQLQERPLQIQQRVQYQQPVTQPPQVQYQQPQVQYQQPVTQQPQVQYQAPVVQQPQVQYQQPAAAQQPQYQYYQQPQYTYQQTQSQPYYQSAYQQQQQPSYAQYQQPAYYYAGAPQSSGQYYSTPPDRGGSRYSDPISSLLGLSGLSRPSTTLAAAGSSLLRATSLLFG